MNPATCVVNANEFRQALDKAYRAAMRKSRIPVLEEALVRFDGSTCAFTCTDLELWCQTTIPAQGDSCAFVLRDSKKLLTACKYFSGDMELTYAEVQPKEAPPRVDPNGILTLRCGNKTLTQQVTTSADFPAMPKTETIYSYTVSPAALSKRFERIKYALSEDDARPCSRCVKFFDSRIGAVDGHRLALNRDNSLCVDEPFYIPPKAMKLLPIMGEDHCQMLISKRYAAFDSGSVRIIVRMPEGEGLDFDAAIPTTCLEEHNVSIPDFISSLRYLGEFIRYPGRETIRFDGGTLSVKTANGEYSSRLELADTPQVVCGFNGTYMLDGLKQFQAKKLDTVAMQTSLPVSPIILRDNEDLAMVLPARLKDAA